MNTELQETQETYIAYFNNVKNSLIQAKLLIDELKQIFFYNNNRLMLIHRNGAHFFDLCMYTFVRTAVTELCKITDPAETGKYKNLSFERIFKNHLTPSDAEYSDIKEQLATLKSEMHEIRYFRDKYVSHNNLELFNEPFTLNLEHFEKVFPLLSDLLNRLGNKVTPGTHYVIDMITDLKGDARSVLLVMEWGNRARHEYFEEVKRDPCSESITTSHRDITAYIDQKPTAG